MSLNVEQREALRAIADGKGSKVRDIIMRSLRIKGLVDESGKLTDLGKRDLRAILASGDEPEALKEMFRF